MARIRKDLSLTQARAEAHRLGLHLHEDYYALGHGQTEILDRIQARTRWRQSPSSAAMGRSRRYSFFLALQKAR